MEAALKEVFSVHRNIVRGLRMELSRAARKRDELKERLNWSCEQLEEAFRSVCKWSALLHNVTGTLTCQGGNGRQDVKSFADASSPILSSSENLEIAQILEKELNIVIQTLSRVTQQLKEACDAEKLCQNGIQLFDAGDKQNCQSGNRSTENAPPLQRKEQSHSQNIISENGPPSRRKVQDQNQNRITENTLSSQSRLRRKRENENFQHLGERSHTDSHTPSHDDDKLLEKAGELVSERRANWNGQKGKDLEGMKKADVQESVEQRSAQRGEGHCLLAGASSSKHLSNVIETVSRNAVCERGMESQTAASEKSPEQGTKLQLVRHAAKRRRYTEEPGGLKKPKRQCRKNSSGSKQDRCPNGDGRSQSDGGIPPLEMCGDGPDNNTSCHRQSADKRRDQHGNAAASDISAIPQTKPIRESSHAQDSPGTRDCSSSCSQEVRGEVSVAGNADAIIKVPETLGVDLFFSQADVEAEDQPLLSSTCKSISGADGGPPNQDEKQKTSSSTSYSQTKIVTADSEECDNAGCRTKGKSSEGRREDQAGWPTDSVVFGSAGPRLPRNTVPEPVSNGSLYIEEGPKDADCSPVFVAHLNQGLQGRLSPALFDEVSDTDDEDCISGSPLRVLSRTHTCVPTQRSAVVENIRNPGVSLVSSMVSQLPQTLSRGRPTRDSSSFVTPSCHTRRASKREAKHSLTDQPVSDVLKSPLSTSPHHYEPATATSPHQPEPTMLTSPHLEPQMSTSQHHLEPQSMMPHLLETTVSTSPNFLKPQVSSSQHLPDPAVSACVEPPVALSSQLPDNSGANHGALLTNTVHSTALTPAPRKKLFKSKSAPPPPPSADDTINPRLLDCTTGDHEECLARAEVLSSQSKQTRTDGQSSQRERTDLCSQLNASLDPALRLTQYLKESDTVNTLTVGEAKSCQLSEDMDGEEDGDVTLDPGFQRVHQTSGQDVTLISLSGSEVARDWPASTLTVPVIETGRSSTKMASLEDSFDRVPAKKAQASYAFNEVVRKQTERRKLRAFSCPDCKKYYGAMGLADVEVKKRMAQCSRHRARQAPPSTPEHFWSIGFPDSEECEERCKSSSVRNGRG